MPTCVAEQGEESNYLQSYILIWLDEGLTNDDKKQEILEKLRSTINYQKTYNNLEHCRQFIKTLKTERLVIISDGVLGEQLISSLDEWQNISAVYICSKDNLPKKEQLPSNEKGNIFMVSIDDLVEKMEIDQRRRERLENSISFSFDKEHASANSTTTPDYSFLMFELLMDATLLNNETYNMNEFIKLCKTEYAGNKVEEHRIDEFQQNYTPETSVKWYTKNCFVYRILNTALRLQNIEVLLACRFLIRDINQQLRNLQQDQHGRVIKVYRGQYLSIADLERMKQNNGEIVSLHSFLSTSYDRVQAVGFVPTASKDENLTNVLFEIECDQHSSLPTSKPFANIRSVSSMPQENEVLFTLGTHFRVTGTVYDEKHHLQIIKLTHISATKKLKQSSEDITCMSRSHPASRQLLAQQIEDDIYEIYYRSLFSNVSENESKVMIYIIAGNGAREQKNFDLSLKYLQKALDIHRSLHYPNERHITRIRNYMRIVQERKGDCEREEQHFGEPPQRMRVTEESRNHEKTNEDDSFSDHYDELCQRQRMYLPFHCVYSTANQKHGQMIGINFYPGELDHKILRCQRMLALSVKSTSKNEYLHRSLEKILAYLKAIRGNNIAHNL